jgi:hypothetical protein
MFMTITLSRVPPQEWDPAFRKRWIGLLERTGEAVSDADAERLRAVRTDLDAFVQALDPEGGYWPVYGALIVNLRNIVEALDVVATAQPVQVPSPAALRA